MKKAGRILLIILSAIIIPAGIWVALNRKLVSYGIDQLKGQLRIVRNAVELDDLLADPATPDTLREKIEYIARVRRFAIDSLGLKDTDNYTTLYDQQDKPLLWVLTASEAYDIKAYEWHFPVLGNVSYKGFFRYEDGVEEQRKLIDKGYDTDYGEVSAWSTLGWFRDPILSSMLKRSEGRLAELIIHEMTHATLYVKSDVDFNENLASFIGEEGASAFLKSAYGDTDSLLLKYGQYKEDYHAFSGYMLRAASLMDSLYERMNEFEDEQKQQVKDSMLAIILQNLDTLKLNDPGRYKLRFRQREFNNAYLMNFIRYDAYRHSLQAELATKFNGNIRRYLEFLAETHAR